MILQDGSIVELKNHSPQPSETLMMLSEEVRELLPYSSASWHTHPKENVNLSATDYAMFLGMPGLTHYIVAGRRVRSFIVRNNKVMLDEADCI